VLHFIDQALIDCLAVSADTTEELRDGIESPRHVLNAHLEHHSRLDRFFHSLRCLTLQFAQAVELHWLQWVALRIINLVIDFTNLLLVAHRLPEVSEFDRHKDGALKQIFLQFARVELLGRFFKLTDCLGLLCAAFVMRPCQIVALFDLLEEQEDSLQTTLYVALFLIV